MIEAKSVLSDENIMQGVNLHFKYKQRTFRLLTIFGAVYLFAIVFTVTANMISFENFISFLPFLLPCLFFFGLPLLIMQVAKRNIRKAPLHGHEIIWRVNELQLSGTTSDSDFSQTWTSMSEAIISPYGILVYPQGGAFHWLPKSAFSSEKEFQLIEQYIKNSIPKYKIVN